MEANTSRSKDPTQNPSISQNPAQNPDSPYYLHAGENPETVLINLQLDDNNYHQWSRVMRRALLSKNKHKFIDGTLPAPETSTSLQETWERCNMIVISWVTQTLSEQIAQSVVYIEDARDLWEDLREHFSKGDLFRILDLLQDIHSMRQGERTVTEFYTNLKILWEELEALRPTPDYVCKIKCNCALTKHIQRYKESEYALCLLKVLNDTYLTVKTQILLMEPLPSINRIFSLIIQQEQQLEGNEMVNKGNVMMNSKALFNSSDNQGNWKMFRSNTTRSQGRGKFRYQNNGKQCTHCHRMNHTIDECYFKYGFPPWYKQKGEKNERVINSVVKDKNMKVEEEQENKSDANNKNQFTQGQIYQIMQLIQETKKDFAHKVNNFVNDSSDENTGKGKKNEKS